MYYLPTSIIFIALSIAIFIYTIKNGKEKREKHNFVNEILIGMLFLFSGILFPFMYGSHSEHLPESTLNFLWGSTSLILVLETIVLGSILGKRALRAKRDPEYLASRNYQEFCEDFTRNYVYDFKKDVERKFLHLLPVFVIFFFWTVGAILDAFGVLAIFGLDNYSFAYWLIIMVGFSFVVMFAFADLARLNAYYSIPDWAVAWYKKSVKPQELNTFISSAPLVLSFVPFLFAPFPVFASVALITAGADAVASLVGKKYGKHKFKEDSVKTIEGYVAGGGMTFIIVLMIAGVYNEFWAVNIGIVMTMAIVASLLFFLVDSVLSKNITDNILNPILCGLGMWAILVI